MNKKNTPAFPRTYGGNGHNGMTLRDYFAAKAMQGDWAAQDAEDIGVFHPEMDDEFFDTAARFYYRMADAMLAAREEGEQK